MSNIPSTCTEQKLREAFETVANVKVVNFKFFPNDQKMALIQLNSIEDAVSALIVSLFFVFVDKFYNLKNDSLIFVLFFFCFVRIIK